MPQVIEQSPRLATMTDGEIESLDSANPLDDFLFERHAFRKPAPEQDKRIVLNASLWGVLSTGLSGYSGRYRRGRIESRAVALRRRIQALLEEKEFSEAITHGPNDARNVRYRFAATDGLPKDVRRDPAT